MLFDKLGLVVGSRAAVATERESSVSTLPAGLADSLAARRRLESHEVLLPYDASYRWMKRVLLRRDPGAGKIHLYRYAGAAP